MTPLQKVMGQLHVDFLDHPEFDTPELQAALAQRRGISGTFSAALRGGTPLVLGALGGPASFIAAGVRGSQRMRAQSRRPPSPQLVAAISRQRARLLANQRRPKPGRRAAPARGEWESTPAYLRRIPFGR